MRLHILGADSLGQQQYYRNIVILIGKAFMVTFYRN